MNTGTLISPVLFVLIVVGACIAVAVTLLFDAQRRAWGMLFGLAAGALVVGVGYLTLLR